MGDTVAEQLCRQWSQAKSRRSNFDTHWEDTGRYVWSNHKYFTTRMVTPGEKRNLELFDDTVAQNSQRGAHVLEAVLSRRGTRWGRATARVKELKKSARVTTYFQRVDDVVYAEREAAPSGCYSALHQTYRSQLVFGNDALWVDDRFERGVAVGLLYKPMNLRDVWISRDWQGRPCVLFRRYELPAEQVAEKFDKARIPEGILSKAATNPFEPVELLTVLRHNPDHVPEDIFSKQWLVVDLAPNEKQVLAEGGYEELPLIFSHGELAPDEDYGRGVAMDVLPTAKTLNRIMRDYLRAAEKMADPPLLSHDDGVLGVKRAVRLKAGALTKGGLNSEGKALVAPLYTGANIAIMEQLLTRLDRKLDRAFYTDLFTLLVERPQMTAAEIMERSAEKGVFLGPVVGDQQGQKLGPMFEREIGCLARQRKLPPPPPELIEAGGEYAIEYETPAAQFQRAGEIRQIEEGLASLVALAQQTGDTSVLEVADLRYFARRLLELRGLRGEGIRDEKAVARILAAQRPIAERQQAIEALPQVAKGVRDLSAAQQSAAA